MEGWELHPALSCSMFWYTTASVGISVITEILGVSLPPILTAALILWFMISSMCSLLTCHGICTGGEKIESEDWSCCWWRQRVGVTACLLMFGDPNNSSMWTSFYFVWSYWANLCKTIGSRVFSWCTFGRFDSMFYV
jgi:hypothetical protein